MRQKTLELKARRYAIALYAENGNKVFLPAETYAIGDILITQQSELYKQLKAWPEFRRNPPEDLKELLFKIAPSYRIQTRERTPTGNYRVRKKDIISKDSKLSTTPDELRFALLRKLFAEKGSYNLWNVGGDDAVQADEKPYTGTVILTGKVKAMERGGRGDVPTRYRANVTKPFGLPEGFYCSCPDERWTDAKEGPVAVSGACAHLAALQTYANENPNSIINFLNVSRFDNKQFVLPFNFRKSQHHDIPDLHLEELNFLSAKDVNLSHLKIDVLVNHLFNKGTYFEIGKKLLLIPDIYHPQLLQAVFDGKAFYEVVIQGNVKREVDTEQLTGTKKMLGEMLRLLKDEKYEAKGYALEFRDSKWETVCINYEKGNHIIRVLFNEEFPPVFVYRRKKPDASVEPFLLEKYKHPFSYLFDRDEKLDDRTKQVTDFEVRIPTKIPVPDSLKEDYKENIHKNFKGGLEGVVSRLRVISQPDTNQLAAQLSS